MNIINYKKNNFLALGLKKITVFQLKNIHKETFAESSKITKKIIQKKNTELSFANLVKELENASVFLQERINFFWLCENLSTDNKIRKMATKYRIETESFASNLMNNKKIFNKFNFYFLNIFDKEKKLSIEEKAVVNKLYDDYTSSGILLPIQYKKNILDIEEKIKMLSTSYMKNITSSYAYKIGFTRTQLEGVPDEILKNYAYDSKKKRYMMGSHPSEMISVLRYCEVESTRKRLIKISALGAGSQNTKILLKILKHRKILAEKLNYASYAGLANRNSLVTDAHKIVELLEMTLKKLQVKFESEKKELLQFLNGWKSDKKIGNKSILDSWSWGFAENLRLKSYADFDEENTKKYFELNDTLRSIFNIWEKFFGIKTILKNNVHFFSKQDIYCEFLDKKNKKIGSGIFDLLYRDGKYSSSCIIEMNIRNNKENKHKNPSIFLISNFVPNNAGKVFLTINDARTLFHEAGHFLHHLLLQNNYIRTSTFSFDYLEIHSHIFENFLISDFLLSQVKNHYSKELMPENMKKAFVKALRAGEVSSWVVQSVYALFDQYLHGEDTIRWAKDTKEIDDLFVKLYEKNIGLEHVSRIHFASRFLHVVSGYEAKYSAYIISKIYAFLIWEEVSRDNLNENSFKKYKNLLGSPNIEKESLILNNFLGTLDNIML